MIEGSPITPGKQNQLVLGETASRILGAKVGDVITLMAILPGGNLAGRDFAVCGLFSAPGTDKSFAYTDYATAADFTAMTSPPVLIVLAKDIDAVPAIARGLPTDVCLQDVEETSPSSTSR